MSTAPDNAFTHSQPRPLKLLFLCTHNRCRSILAEAIASQMGGELLQAASAGSEPASEIHPLTLRSLERHGIGKTGLHSKSLADVRDYSPDFVISVCDKAAEFCPHYGSPVPKMHWGLADPSSLDDEEASEEAFDQTIAILTSRLKWLREGVEQGLNQQGLVMLIRALGDAAALEAGKSD